MDLLTPEKISEFQDRINAFDPSAYKKMSEYNKINKALNLYNEGSKLYDKGDYLSAYPKLYLFASWVTMVYKKPEDETYVKSMLGASMRSCMNYLETMKNKAEMLSKEKEEAQENQKRLQELAAARKKVAPSSDSRWNNNTPSAVNKSSPTLHNGLMSHRKSDYIIKPEDKYEAATPPVQSSLSCEELQTLLNDAKSSVLLVDCRSQNEFNTSTMKPERESSLINVPPEINVRGLSARTLGDRLGERHKTVWSIRSTFDRIVLFDSFSRVKEGSVDTSLERLLMIIKEFDVNTVYKTPPILLKGGFEAWHTRFPYHTTNPANHKPVIPFPVLVPVSLNTIDYSLLDDTPPSPSPPSPTPSPPPPSSSSSVTTHGGGEVLGSEMGYPASESGGYPGGGTPLRPSSGPLRPSSVPSGEIPPHRPPGDVGGAVYPPPDLGKAMPRVDRSSKPSEHINGASSRIRANENGTESPARSKSIINHDGDVLASHTERLRFHEVSEEEGSGNKPSSLQSFPGSALKRSSSVPDLSRMNGGDTLHEGRTSSSTSSNVPEFDRSKKPYQDRLSHYDRRDSSVAGTNVGPGLTGLKNLGNTCYINSVLQCLSNTSPLRSYFESEFKKTMASYGRNHVTRPVGGAGGRLAEEFQVIFRMLWAGDLRYFSPVKFKEEVGKMKRTFRGYEQQDSHEFLTILIDSLHEDLKEPEHKNSLTGALVESGEKSWGEFLKKNKSIVSQLFYGQLKSTVMCLSCQETSSTFEVFSNLSLPLPSNDRCSLKDCLELYLQGEEIQGWHCPRCKTKRDAKKKLDITILPPILVLHFKRFTSDGWCRKKQTTVEFPENSLSMSEFNINPESRDSRYDLYAVSNHYGTMESGHYTAYCRNKYKWYKFDDSDVSEISSSKLVSPAAYILFYMSSRLEH